MHAVIRLYRQLEDFEQVAHLVESELVPLLREVEGFQGYYAIRCGRTAGLSITLFDDVDAARAGNQRGMSWVCAHLAELYGDHPPETLTGEVVVASAP